MKNGIINDHTNEDILILDRDQTNHSDEKPSTPPPNHLTLNQLGAAITYEIVKTQDQHVVQVHEQPPIDTTNVENEQGIIRRLTQDNPVIPDDIFFSPISSYSSSEDTVRAVTGTQTPLGGHTSQCETIYRPYSKHQSVLSPNSFSPTRQRKEAEDCHSPS